MTATADRPYYTAAWAYAGVQFKARHAWDPQAHPRDDHGRFAHTPGVSVPRHHPSRSGRPGRGSAVSAPATTSTSSSRATTTTRTSSSVERSSSAQLIRINPQGLTVMSAAVHNSQLYTATRVDQVAKEMQQVKEKLETEEKDRSRADLIIRLAFIAAGVLFAHYMGGQGGGEEAAAGLAGLASFIPDVTEVVKEFVVYNVVGRLRGAWHLAHPTEAARLAAARTQDAARRAGRRVAKKKPVQRLRMRKRKRAAT